MKLDLQNSFFKKNTSRIIQIGHRCLDSNLFFYLTLFISTLLILIMPVYPSVDGAAHLYNSAIIKDLILNTSSLYSSFYTFNPVIVPNWLDHVLLALLMCVFTTLWAQKIFLVLLITLQAQLFRLIIKELNPENKLLSSLIFPFIFSAFFYIGLYNQQLSFLIFFASLYWLLKAKSDGRFYYLALFVFSALLWLSSIITYAIFIAFIGLFTLLTLFKDKKWDRVSLKKLGSIGLVFLPTILLSINFISKVSMITDEKPINLINKLILFFRLDPLIIFDVAGESKFTIPLIGILVILLISSYKSKSKNNTVVRTLQIISIILGLLFIAVPNHAGAGMLSFRLAMSLYLIVILLISISDHHKTVLKLTSIAVLGIHFGLTFKRHNGQLKAHTQASKNYLEIGKHIHQGATVWPISDNEHWFLGHSNNYLGMANSSIILENYETYYPWFPLLFKPDKSHLNTIYNGLRIQKKLLDYDKIPADYLVVNQKQEVNLWMQKAIQHQTMRLVFQTADSTMKLYKLKPI